MLSRPLPKKSQKNTKWWYQAVNEITARWQLYLLLLIPLTFLIVFAYFPMYGAQIAFRSYRAVDGIAGSKWVGLKYFGKFIGSYQFRRVLSNTLLLSIYQLLASFPIPVIFALSLNCVESKAFTKTVQMITYAPHFISMVVIVGIMMRFFSYQFGIVNNVIRLFGGEGLLFLGEAKYFRSVYVWSGIWQEMGYSAIIYISALSAVDPSLYEAAKVDGASRFKQLVHVDLPCILPAIITMLILRSGQLLSIGHEKVLLLQNDMNINTSDVISTYVYRLVFKSGIPDYSYSTAVGLFNSVINFAVVISVNAVSRRVSDTSLW